MEDRKIVKLLLDRAENAIDALQEKFGKLIYHISMNILQVAQDAQECTNDTYLARWNAIPPARPDPLTPYVGRTGRNVALNRLHTDSTQKRDGRYALSIDELADALNEIRDEHIEEAAKPRKKRNKLLLRLSAAAAMVALVVAIALSPAKITAEAVSLPGQSRSNGLYQETAAAAQALSDFFIKGSAQFVGGEENTIWSPVNAFIGLSMAAELTQGNSRQQILELFGAEDLDTLRSYGETIWESVYKNDGDEICTLANSLWLSEELRYEQSTMDDLSYYYYASIYKGKMGSKKMNNAISAWLERNTGGMLKKSSDNISLTPDTVLALYSTVYLQSKWLNEFASSNNTDGVFHSPDGDRQVTFMNKKKSAMQYYWADQFGAVNLKLKNGSEIWFILPDEGVSVDQVLADGQYMQMICDNWEQSGYYFANLSVPKFDITYGQNLKNGLKELGVTDIFDMEKADFSAITDRNIYFTTANQNVRLTVDEEGVKAAAYIELPGAMNSEPPEDTVDFVLDRPFLFVLSNSKVPLFVGTVSQP